MRLDIDFHNYDKAFKDAFSVFNNKVLGFLGMDLNLPRIERFAETEFAEIETKGDRLDLNFWLEDGSILHLEEEVSLSRNDLIRFAAYDLKLFSRYDTKIHTLVLCINEVNPELTCFSTGTVHYRLQALDMSQKDGDDKLQELRQKISNHQPVNELEAIFLPLMKSNKSKVEQLKATIELEKQLDVEPNLKEKIMALTLVLADKFVDREQLTKIWEEIKMLKVIDFAVEKGKIDLMLLLLTKKFKNIPEEYKENLARLDSVTLDALATDILDMRDVKELEKYF